MDVVCVVPTNGERVVARAITIEISSRENTKERRIDELLTRLKGGDTLIVAELSRLGRNMLETLNIINELSENGVKLVFVRQPELSTIGPHGKLFIPLWAALPGSGCGRRPHSGTPQR